MLLSQLQMPTLICLMDVHGMQNNQKTLTCSSLMISVR